MTDFITALLAKWLDKAKVSNPKIFLFIQLVLMTSLFAIQKGIELGTFTSGAITDALTVVIPLIMAAIGTRTVAHLESADKAKLKAKQDNYRAYHEKGSIRAQSANPHYLD